MRTRREALQSKAFEARVPNALGAFGMERAEPLRRLRRGVVRGLPLTALFWFVFWRVPKNEHSCALCEGGEN